MIYMLQSAVLFHTIAALTLFLVAAFETFVHAPRRPNILMSAVTTQRTPILIPDKSCPELGEQYDEAA